MEMIGQSLIQKSSALSVLTLIAVDEIDQIEDLFAKNFLVYPTHNWT